MRRDYDPGHCCYVAHLLDARELQKHDEKHLARDLHSSTATGQEHDDPSQSSFLPVSWRRNGLHRSCKSDSGNRIATQRRDASIPSYWCVHTVLERARAPTRMAQLTTTPQIEALVHTHIDAARRRTVATTIALDRLSAFLGAAAPTLAPPALPWVDLEIRPTFREPVEICIDCPEKATTGPSFKVLVLLEPEEVAPGVLPFMSPRWRGLVARAGVTQHYASA